MARKNRISVLDGIYHITSRIVNKGQWMSDPDFKDQIVNWLYGTAAFSGVRLLDWCILDNHFHLFVHVPVVPEKYRIAGSEYHIADPETPLIQSAVPPHALIVDPPSTESFTMRPAECNPPRWVPDSLSVSQSAPSRRPSPSTVSGGESPSTVSDALSASQVVPSWGQSPSSAFPRPPTGFMLSDEEMCDRLADLYGDRKRADSMLRSWTEMRHRGDGAAVDAVKDRYCRRMYNVTQFVKTFKEKVSSAIRKRRGHVGHVFEGRFYSGLVQKDACVEQFVSLYIAYNPYKAGLVYPGENYRWSAFGEACRDGKHGASCRAAYEEIFGCAWVEARRMIEVSFQEKMSQDPAWSNAIREGAGTATPGQLIKMALRMISCGAFIGRDLDFGKETLARFDRRFPGPSLKSLRWLAAVVNWPRQHLRVS